MHYLQLTEDVQGRLEFPEFLVRSFEPSEQLTYARLACDPCARGSWPVKETAEQYLKRMEGVSVLGTWLAVVINCASGDAVGFVSAYGNLWETETELMVFLLPEAQGKGPGRQVLDALVERAIARGVVPIARSKTGDTVPEALLARCGFVIDRGGRAADPGEVWWIHQRCAGDVNIHNASV